MKWVFLLRHGFLELLKYLCLCAWPLSHVLLFATSWTVALQAPLSMGFSRQEYWSGFPCVSSGDLPNPGIEPTSPMSPALTGRFFTTVPPGKPLWNTCIYQIADKIVSLAGRRTEAGATHKTWSTLVLRLGSFLSCFIRLDPSFSLSSTSAGKCFISSSCLI